MIFSLIIDCCVDFFKIVMIFFYLYHHVPESCVCTIRIPGSFIGQKRSPKTGVRDDCEQTCEC